MKFLLARELQDRLVRNPPPGWRARMEIGLLSRSLTEMIGYEPTADLVLESVSTNERIWIEFEISRADPVANHAKFGSAHLINPLPPSDAFVSLVSADVARGRANLAAHAIFLLRGVGLRAFQMPLLSQIDGVTIKQLNQGKAPIQNLPTPDMREVIDLTRPLAVEGCSEIYYATNSLEVLLNLHGWNKEITTNASAGLKWGRRRVRYLVFDRKSGLFAPAKFCAYTRMKRGGFENGGVTVVPTMTIDTYAAIDQGHSLFDGQKAWKRLARLGFTRINARDCDMMTAKLLKEWIRDRSNAVLWTRKDAISWSLHELRFAILTCSWVKKHAVRESRNSWGPLIGDNLNELSNDQQFGSVFGTYFDWLVIRINGTQLDQVVLPSLWRLDLF